MRTPAGTRRRGLLLGAGAVVVVAVVALILTFTLNGGHASAQASGPTIVTVARGTVSVDVAAAGTVQASQTRGLSFSTSGTVTVLNVKAGDTVTAGQVLAQIDPSDAQKSVDDAQSAVTDAEQSLADAQAAASAAASASAAAAANPTPSASAGRGGSGASGGTGGSGNSGSNSGGGNSGGGNSGGGAQRASTGTDAIYSATVQLNNAKLALAQAQRKLAGTTITSPIAGTVLAVDGTVGGNENPGSTAFITVGSVADAQVKAEFSEADIAAVKVGQSATVTLPNQAGTVAGKVSSVDPAGTASGNLVRYAVMIGFDQPPASLLYGQSANVTVTTASVAGVLYVSSSAVRDIHDGAGTVTVRTGGRDEDRTVQIGLRGDQYTQITSGLSEGDQVVIANG